MTSHLELRSSVFFAILACLAVALTPWLTGGREPLAMFVSSAALLLGLVLALLQPEIPRLPASWVTRMYLLFAGWGALSLAWTVNRYSTVLWLVTWLSAPAVFYLAYVVKQCRNGDRWLSLIGLIGFVGFGTEAALAGDVVVGIVIAVVFIIYLFTNRNKRVWITIVFSLAMVTTASVLITKVVSPHVGQSSGSSYAVSTAGESSAMSTRVDYLTSVLAMTKDRPLLGFGAGTFGDAHAKYQTGVDDASTSAFNVYAQTLAELGSVGFALFLLFFIPLIFVVHQTTFSVGRPYVFLSLLGLMLIFGLSASAEHSALIWLAAVFAALGYGPRSEPKNNRRYRLLLLVFSQIGLSVAAYYIFVGNVFADRGVSAQGDGDYAAAADYFARATAGPVFNPDWVNSQGIAMLTLSSGKKSVQADEALSLAKKAESLDPLNPNHYQLEAHVLVAEGDIKQAESLLRKAVSLDPNNRPDLYADLAGILWSTGRGEEAVKLAEPFLRKYTPKVVADRSTDPKLKPALANLWGVVGQIYLESHNIANARNCAQQAVKLYPQSLRGRALTNRLNKQ
jgi:tetratricopeptide (TPR) repeat protein